MRLLIELACWERGRPIRAIDDIPPGLEYTVKQEIINNNRCRRSCQDSRLSIGLVDIREFPFNRWPLLSANTAAKRLEGVGRGR